MLPLREISSFIIGILLRFLPHDGVVCLMLTFTEQSGVVSVAKFNSVVDLLSFIATQTIHNEL